MSDVADRLRKLADAAGADSFDIDQQQSALNRLAPDLARGYADALDALESYDRWASCMPGEGVTKYSIWEGWWRQRPERKASLALAAAARLFPEDEA